MITKTINNTCSYILIAGPVCEAIACILTVVFDSDRERTDMDVQNKVCLITGAATGIGSGVARALLDKGAKHVAVLDVNVEQGKALEKELNAKHGNNKMTFFKCDVTTNELHTAFDETVKTFGYIDIVVNNAGIMNDHPTAIEKEIAINVSALITGSLKAYNLMRKDQGGKGGTIINISSIVGLMQSYLLPVYSATKSAVLQFSNCLGKSENFTRSDVRVIAICFGITDTNLIKGRIGCIDDRLEDELLVALKKFPFQSIDSAVQGLITALESGSSGSSWLVASNKPAEDITNNVRKAYEILFQGVL
ncbi:unnamed protein product, partial [Brenthis ino]